MPNPLHCLDVAIPRVVWETLASVTNTFTAADIARGDLANVRRYKVATVDEVKRVFLARLHLIVRHGKTIRAGYEEVHLDFLSFDQS